MGDGAGVVGELSDAVVGGGADGDDSGLLSLKGV